MQERNQVQKSAFLHGQTQFWSLAGTFTGRHQNLHGAITPNHLESIEGEFNHE
jgi:hypothetical protein